MQNETNDTSSSPPISRRSAMDYAGASSAIYRLRRMMPAREKAIDAVKTLAWVVPLTLIIWVYAEQEQVLQTPANVGNVQVQLKSTDGRYVAFSGSADPTVTSVTLKLTGPQEAVRRVSDELTKIGGQKPIIYLDSNRPNGNNELVNVVDAIQDQDVFRKNGVTVKECLPPELSINVDKIARRELVLQIPPSVANLSPASKFDPPKITVSGPEKLLTHLVDEQDLLKVYANLDGLEQLKHPGDYPNLSVLVQLSPSYPELVIDPPKVKASIKVLQSDVQAKIDSIPIEVQVAPGMMGAYDLSLTKGGSINDVTVTGPQQDIDALKTFPNKAILELLPEDASRQMPKTLRFELPPNVKISAEDAGRTVEFTLTKKPD